MLPPARPPLFPPLLTHPTLPAENYDFGTKEQAADNRTPDQRVEVPLIPAPPPPPPLPADLTDLARAGSNGPQDYKKAYADEGMGRKARAVILTHLHGHPHLLLFKPKKEKRDREDTPFKLPGCDRSDPFPKPFSEQIYGC